MRLFHRIRSRLIHSTSNAVTGLLLGFGCALAIQAMVSLHWFDGLERSSQDFLFNARGQRLPAPEIVQVVTDNKTVAHYHTWPLQRGVYAKTVNILKRAGAKTIALDILFSESSLSPRDDAALIQACNRAGNVIQASTFHVENRYNPELPANAVGLSGNFSSRFALKGENAQVAEVIPSAVWVSAALPALRKMAPLLGHINIHPRRDGSLRSIPHVIAYRGAYYPSLALAAATHFLNTTPNQVEVGTSGINIAGRRIPLDSSGETLINWAGDNSTFPTYSLYQVVEGEVPPEAFEGKIVLVGVTSAGSYESRATPFSSVQPALDLQANALDNILRNRPLRTVGLWPQFILLLVVSLIAGVLIAPRLELVGTLLLVGLTGGLWLIALWLLSAYSFYFPVAASIISAALTYSLAMAVNYRTEWESNSRTDAAVLALARGGALMATGQNRSRLETVVKAAARDALQAQEIHLVQVNSKAGDQEDEALGAIARQLQSRRRAVLYPFPRRVPRVEQPFIPDANLQKLLATLRQQTKQARTSIVAAPLIPARALPATGETPAPLAVSTALIAVGSREHRSFGFRDAVMLEAIAKQASLAFENLEYSELLQGRIELANRDLRDAYIVLAEQSAKFMAAVESIDDALIICDAAGNAIFVNAGAALTLRGVTPKMGHNVPEILREQGLVATAALFDCLSLNLSVADAQPATCEEIWTSGKEEEEEEEEDRVFSAQLTPLFADGDRLLGAMLLVSDITNQRELDQMKTDFVSFVAHELRSPLSTILGYASLLEQYGEQTDLQTRNDMAAAIGRQCHRLNRLINDLLDISRLEAGRTLELRRERVELRGMLEKVLEAQRAALSHPHITLEMQCSEAAVSVWGDPDRLEQIMVNLISNAVKYSPDGGKILASVEDHGTQVVLRVQDEGMGMTADQLENLFQRFYRTPDARRLGIKGTGLGLFLVKNLIEAHHGQVQVSSEVGQGTTFSIALPRRAGSQPLFGDDETDPDDHVEIK